MLTRRALLALSACLLGGLSGCSDDSTGPRREVDPAVKTEPTTIRVIIPRSFLDFCDLSAADALEDFSRGDDVAYDAFVEGDDLVLALTDAQHARQVGAWEDELGERVEAMAADEGVASVEVADDLRGVTVRARPSLVDEPDGPVGNLYVVVAACGYLQLLDGQEDWGVTVSLIDDGTGVEVARATLPDEELAIGREAWEDAVGAPGA